MVKNSEELALISQEWADRAKKSIADSLIGFMQKNQIGFEALCSVMPIDSDILEDILEGDSDMISMNELSAIMVCLDLVAEIKPANLTPISFGSGNEKENIIIEAQNYGREFNSYKIGCGIVMSDNPKLQEALETIVEMFENDPKSIDAFIGLFGKR